MSRTRVDPMCKAVPLTISLSPSDLSWLKNQAEKMRQKYAAPNVSAVIRALIDKNRKKG